MPARRQEAKGRSGSSRARTLALMAGAFVVGIVLTAVVVSCLPKGSAPQEAAPAVSPGVATPGGGSPSPDGSGASSASQSDAELARTSDQVVPGLWLGTAMVTSGNSDEIFGVRVGWPHTVEGAVSAAMNYDAARASEAAANKETRPKLITRLTLPSVRDKIQPAFSDTNHDVNAKLGLNDLAEPTDPPRPGEPTPRVSVAERAYLLGMPVYGAYQVRRSTPNEVLVDTWEPLALGRGTDTDLSRVLTRFIMSRYTMAWDGADWKIKEATWLQPKYSPADPSYTNQSYQSRREVLGEGWVVPQDASEQPLPGMVKTRS